MRYEDYSTNDANDEMSSVKDEEVDICGWFSAEYRPQSNAEPRNASQRGKKLRFQNCPRRRQSGIFQGLSKLKLEAR